MYDAADRLLTLTFAYVITDNDTFGDKAKEALLNYAGWPVLGAVEQR